MADFTPPCYCEVNVYSHGFQVTVKNGLLLKHIRAFAKRYALFGFVKGADGKQKYAPTDFLFDESISGTVFTFHKEQYKEFMSVMAYAGFGEDRMTIRTWGHKEFKTYDMNIKLDGRQLREEQHSAVNFIEEKRKNGVHSALLAMPTGTGKTLTSLYIACLHKQRTAVMVRATYVKQWVGDILKNTDTKREEILEICGGSDGISVRELLSMSEEELEPYKFVIFSQETMRNYFDDYMEANCIEGDYGFPVSPHMLFPYLNIGFCIFDEMHESIKLVFRCLCYCHVPFVLGLSATFMAQEADVVQLQSLLMPESLRFTDIQMKKYIDCYSLGYRFKHYDPKRVKTKANGSTMYSHDAFEASIMRNKPMLKGYLDLIAYIFYSLYKGDYDGYKPGDKAAVYVFRRDMCDLVVTRLKQQYPDLDIRRFVSGDPFDNAINADIRVTTIGSFGAGKDVPGLCFSLLTNSLNKPSTNIQILGRLREIIGTSVKFAFLWCAQIPKHVEYADEKEKWLKPRTASLAKYLISNYV